MLNGNDNSANSLTVNKLHQLPLPPSDFTGRRKELDDILHQVQEWCVLINDIYGEQGVGKTGLALVIAGRLAADYPDGQLFIDLRGSNSQPLPPEQVLGMVIHSFWPETDLPDDLISLVGLYNLVLTGKKCLLLMDNADDDGQVSHLIPPAGNLLLLTSRTKLSQAGMSSICLEALPESDAVKLLSKIAPRLETVAAQAAKLCACLPFNLRLLAGLVAENPNLSVDKVLKKLNETQKRLKNNPVDSLLQVTYEHLGADYQTALRKLSVFAGSFDNTAAAAVWQVEEPPARETLDKLARSGLLQDLNGRFALHDLTREFLKRFIKEEENFAAQGRFAAYYARILALTGEYCRQDGEHYKAGLALFDREWENISAGQDWAAHNQLIDKRVARLMLNYAGSGEDCLEQRLNPRERIRWMDNGLRASRLIENRPGESDMLNHLGRAYADLGENLRALGYHEDQLIITRETGDRCKEARALYNLGAVYSAMSQMNQAIKYYDQALAVNTEVKNLRGACKTLHRLGRIYSEMGETNRALSYFEQQLSIARECGDRRAEGLALGNLGLAYIDLDEASRAIVYFEQQLSVTRETGDRQGEGQALGHLGAAYAGINELNLAITYLEQQLQVTRETGERSLEGHCLERLGGVYNRLGDDPQAIACYGQSLAIKRENGDRHGEGAILGTLGTIYLNREQSLQAIAYFEQQLVIMREIGVRHGEANVSWNLGLAYAQLQQFEKAASFMQPRVDYEKTIRHSSAEVHASVVEILRLLK
ncbi:MAG: tetratricopeptide repeat protein [Anaerolineae bacterium]|nr:tetratricopeptide repeat protein [Anaerolineae bacterium]